MLYFFKLVLLVVSLSSSFLVHASKDKNICFLIVKPKDQKSDDALKTHLQKYELELISSKSLTQTIKNFPSVFTDGAKSIKVKESVDTNQKSLPLFEILYAIKATAGNYKKLSELTNEWYANKKESSTEEIFIYNVDDNTTTFHKVMLSTTEKAVVGSLLFVTFAATAYGAYRLPFTKTAFSYVSQKSIPLLKNSWSCMAKGSSTVVKHAANCGSAIGTQCSSAAQYVWGMIPSFRTTPTL